MTSSSLNGLTIASIFFIASSSLETSPRCATALAFAARKEHSSGSLPNRWYVGSLHAARLEAFSNRDASRRGEI